MAKQLARIVLLAAGLLMVMILLGGTLPAAAQQPTPAPTGQTGPGEISGTICPWAFKTGGFSQNWTEGLTYFILGIIGALATVYLFVGEFLPSMGGKAEYELLKIELENTKKLRDHTLAFRADAIENGVPPLPTDKINALNDLSDDYEKTIDRLEKQLSQERWRLFLLAFPIYIFLGGFFATAFSLNYLQAVLIGFGWTIVADRIGLSREEAAKKDIRDTQISLLEENARKAEKSNQELQKEITSLHEELHAAKVREESYKAAFEQAAAPRTETPE